MTAPRAPSQTIPRLRVLFIGLVLLLIRMGQKFGPCNAQLSGKTRIPRNSTLTTAITTTRSIIGLDLPKNSQVQLSGLLRRYLSGRLCHSSVLPASFSIIFTIKWYVSFTFVLFFFKSLTNLPFIFSNYLQPIKTTKPADNERRTLGSDVGRENGLGLRRFFFFHFIIHLSCNTIIFIIYLRVLCINILKFESQIWLENRDENSYQIIMKN